MNWFKRHWIWVVPIGCLGAIISVGGILFACFWLVFALTRQSAVFGDAMVMVRDDRQVVAALGEPIEPGWWLLGNLQITGPSGSADLMFPISGPHGSATVYLVAEKEAGEWFFDRLEVKLKGHDDRLDLLGAEPEWNVALPRLTRPPGPWYRSAFHPPPPERCAGPDRPPPVRAAGRRTE